MAPEELPGMTEFVVLSTLLGPEVFRIPKDSAAMGGLAPSVDFLLLLEQELSIPKQSLLTIIDLNPPAVVLPLVASLRCHNYK
jgi:hypothetical protein